MKYKLIFYTITLFLHFTARSQTSFSDDTLILKVLLEYKDCNSICVNSKLIESDNEVYIMIKNLNNSKRKFAKLIKKLDLSMPNLSRHTKTILSYKTNKAWNETIKSVYSTSNCIDSNFRLSIMKPIEINKDEVLLIAAVYKYDLDKYDFESFVYFYDIKKIEENWKICGTDHVYDIMFDWKTN